MLKCVISCREAVDVDQHQTAQEMRIERDARPPWRQESRAASRRERNPKGPETMLDRLRASTGNGSEAPRRARTPSVCGESPAETATQRFITSRPLERMVPRGEHRTPHASAGAKHSARGRALRQPQLIFLR